MAAYFRHIPCIQRGHHFTIYDEHYIVRAGYEMKFKADYKFGEDDQFRIETGDQIFCLELTSVQYMYSDTDNVVSMHH
jgi:regulator of RNase E activity RraB